MYVYLRSIVLLNRNESTSQHHLSARLVLTVVLTFLLMSYYYILIGIVVFRLELGEKKERENLFKISSFLVRSFVRRDRERGGGSEEKNQIVKIKFSLHFI